MGMYGYLKQISPESLKMIKNDSYSLVSIVFPDENTEDTYLDMDKAWQGIHFLLTGVQCGGDPPLTYTILGGSVIEDDNFIAAFYVTPDKVKEVAEALLNISEKELENRFKPEEMNRLEIYPLNWSEEDFSYLISYFKEIVEYYKSAAGKGYAMLMYIT